MIDMSDFKKELPTSEKLNQDIKSGKKLISLLTLGGRVSLFKGIDKDMYKHIVKLEKQANELISNIEEFNNNFSEHGWISYELLKNDVIKVANQRYNQNGLKEAQKYLISFYSNEIEEYLPFLKRNKEFSIRYNLILSAFEDHKAKRYNQCIPIFLMMIDGAVSDFSKTGFAAEKTDVEAWDSLAGHSQGLSRLKEIYTKNRTKTTTEPIYLPYRNGILHGRDLNYGNEYVSCKALAMIFAVNDWLTAKKTEEVRKKKFTESTQMPSMSELVSKMKENEHQKQLIADWTPRSIVIGQDIPSRGTPDEFQDGTPEKTVALFMDYWRRNNFGLMAECLDSRFFYDKSGKKRAGLCREMFSNKFSKVMILIQ